MNPWLPHSFDPTSPTPRILCFPHAGGGTALFHRWNRELSDLDLVPVNLPGRESRMEEPACDSLPQLIAQLMQHVAPICQAPFGVFGYSMGGLIAFEFLRALRAADSPPAQHLWVGACRAPQLPRTREPLHALDDEPLLDELLRVYGMSDETSADERNLMRVMTQTLRADLRLFETYTYEDAPPLELPITAIGGNGDPQVNRANLEAWRVQTTGSFKSRMVPGHHFFLRTQSPAILDLFRIGFGS